MAILHLEKDGLWYFDMELEPVEFWPYTTIVHEVVFTGPRDSFNRIEKDLVDKFKTAGINIGADNKTAYGVKDYKGKIWYFGFKDFWFDLGMAVDSRDHKEPIRKKIR